MCDLECAAGFLPHLASLVLEKTGHCAGAVHVWAQARGGQASCPRCGFPSAAVHSRYQRTLADAVIAGRQVVVHLRVRRFFCREAGCAAATFAEQVAGLTCRYARRTDWARSVLEQVGVALAGRAGARMTAALGITVSRTTLLRLVRALPDPPAGEVTVLGVDDFALRRGHVYGTVLVDIGRHKAIDMLEDREAATLAAWLEDHPGIEVICRDRAGAYAEGARAGAPDAIQVADRWHLWHNLAEYAEKTVVRHRACLKEPAPDPAATAAAPPGPGPAGAGPPDGQQAPPGEPDGLRDVCGRERRLVARTRERHAAVHELLAAGQSLGAICRALSLDRKTVQRFARAASAGELLAKATSRDSKLDPFKPYLNQRWNEGLTDAAALHAELQAAGWQGSAQAVRRYVRPFRPMTAAPPPAPAVPKARQITSWLLRHPGTLDPDEQASLAGIRARCPHLDSLAGHVSAFAEMMTGRQGQHLQDWLTHVEADDQPELHSFATGIRQDHQAVINGLTLPYSSGMVEGIVNKIKAIKRQMYGRAKPDLLRKRVLLAS